MKHIELFLRNEIRKFNNKTGFDLKISKIVFWKKNEALYVEASKSSGVIKINPSNTRKEILEDLYHELGHALIHQTIVPKKLLSSFRNSSPLLSRVKTQRLIDSGEDPPPRGFVSWYALTNGSEDFCETLSALVVSGYKTKEAIHFGDWVLSKDGKLQIKLERILKYLQQA